MTTLFAFAAWLFAQGDKGGSGLSQWGMLPWIVGTVILFYLIVLKPQRREQATQKSMIANLKKNDRVLTIGGILGVVTNVEREKDRIKIRVDEKNNTELTITFQAVSRVLRDDAAPAAVTEKTSK